MVGPAMSALCDPNSISLYWQLGILSVVTVRGKRGLLSAVIDRLHDTAPDAPACGNGETLDRRLSFALAIWILSNYLVNIAQAIVSGP